MTAYADYTFYTGTYGGSAIASGDFTRLANKASAQIDRVTFGRAATDTDNTTAIKNAMCEVAEEIQRQEQNDNADGITSESQGQYSVSYAAGSVKTKTNTEKIEAAARIWLENTFLMFPGFNDGEYGDETDDT